MTTTIPALDYSIAGFLFAWLLLGAYAARQWIVRHTGRAKPLPDIEPDRDEASAEEGGVVVGVPSGLRPIEREAAIRFAIAAMQGNAQEGA